MSTISVYWKNIVDCNCIACNSQIISSLSVLNVTCFASYSIMHFSCVERCMCVSICWMYVSMRVILKLEIIWSNFYDDYIKPTREKKQERKIVCQA